MKYLFTLFFCLSCLVCQAQPPANTFKSKVYGNKTVYINKTGQQIGSSKNYGRHTTYYNGTGKVLSREYKYRSGSTYIRSH